MDIKKFTKEVNKATYLTVVVLFSFENIKNNAPIVGKIISDDKIGKFIILRLEKLVMLKNQLIS
jgi:hypothetical protein